MNTKEAYRQVLLGLADQYEERESRNIAKILIEDLFGPYSLGMNRTLTKNEAQQLQNAQNRLLKGEPLQYVTGVSDFYGLKFFVDNRVLIPRPETEELVDLVLSTHDDSSVMKVLDVGTGSGCIPISIAANRSEWDIYAIDISEEALIVATQNSLTNNVDVQFSILDILDKGAWPLCMNLDILISNPPYIPAEEKSLMRPNVLDYEPHIALFVEDIDSLVYYKRILDFAKLQVKNGGYIYFECNEYSSQQLYTYVNTLTWIVNPKLCLDLEGKDRILKCQIA